MFKLHDKWVQVSFIYKATNSAGLDENAEQWQIDQMMNEAEIIVTKEWILRDDIKGLKEAMPAAKDTLERDDIALLCMFGEESTHILMDEEEKLDFLSAVGPQSIYTAKEKEPIKKKNKKKWYKWWL